MSTCTPPKSQEAIMRKIATEDDKHPPQKNRQHLLVRTTSLEKIRRFNNFICTQHYFFFPAILTWLKSMKKSSSYDNDEKKMVFFLRSWIVTNLLILRNNKQLIFQIQVRNAFKNCLNLIYDKLMIYWKVYLTLAVYSSIVILIMELLLCFYFVLMPNYLPPIGLLFLIACLSLIIYINYVTHRTQLNRLLIFTERRN